MDGLTLFGFVAVTFMLVFYALEERSRWFILAFAGACALGSARVRELVAAHTVRRDLGILGEPRVNVLELNLAVDTM